jgi:enoyl-CoA hydratase/carnithine racemase
MKVIARRRRRDRTVDRALVGYESADGVAFLTLAHPEKRNALSRGLLAQLGDLLANVRRDRGVRVVVLRAEGPVFSAGHDLRELTDGREEDYASLFALCTQVMEAVRTLPQPVIASVQGLATAAGCQLVATCDLVVASEKAAFATPGVRIGLFCTTPAVALSRAVGPKLALEMLLTGNPIDAAAAHAAGLVNRVVPPDRLAEETLALARQIAAASPDVVALGKRAFYEQLPLDRPAAYALAGRCMTENALAADAQEGMHAFLEKRPPQWGRGRT